MDTAVPTAILHFEGFRLDRGGLFQLDPAGLAAPIALGSRALDVLGFLVERHGELISRDRIMEAVWPGTAVEEANLTVQISTLRRVLDQNRAQGSCIQTVAGRGYRFVAPVERADSAPVPVCEAASGNGSGNPIAQNGAIQSQSVPGQIRPVSAAPARRTRYRLWGGIVVAAIGVLLIAVVLVAWNRRAPLPGDARTVPRLSIVVLPFTNISDDRDQQYFADGITDDLTTDLSRAVGMFVISRNTAFTYRNKPADAKQIGRELGVRYVLEGSIRRSGNQLRVNAQLIDAETDAHLWAERFDRDAGDLLGLQNEITGRIANTLDLELLGAETARPTDNPDALDCILRGRAASAKPQSREKFAEAIGLYERALALDPRSLEAQIRLATALVDRVLDEMTDSAAADIARAEPLIGQVLAASPRNPLAHYAKGQLLRTQHRCEEAVPEYHAALASNPNWASALSHIGRCKTYIGLMEEAIALQEQAIRLNPRDPGIGVYYFRIGEAHLLRSRTDEAIVWLEKARDAMPGHPATQRFLASAYGLKGETGRAAATLAEARRLNPDGRYSSIARVKADRSSLSPRVVALYESTYLAGLRKAGMPDE